MAGINAAYPFEAKVFAFARAFSGGGGFVIAIERDGPPCVAAFEGSESSWRERLRSLEEAGTAYLCYDPSDLGEWAFVAWNGIDRLLMQRLIGEALVEADFAVVKTFPSSWSVIF